jgi:GntR family transcriptional repressor for pyruvate dehydrogenase complex
MPSERQLSESFGVGRSVVREALKSLGLLGLVEVRQGDGTYVKSPDSTLLPRVVEWGLLVGDEKTADLIETRKHLEVVTTRLAAERRNEMDLLVIRQKLEAMHAATTTEEFVDADVAFHLAIAAASGNSVLSNMLTSISSLLDYWIRRVMNAAESFEPSYCEHVPVYDGIVEQNVDAAGEAMARHMEGAAKRLHDALEESRAERNAAQGA